MSSKVSFIVICLGLLLSSCAMRQLTDQEIDLYKSEIKTQRELALNEANIDLLKLQLGELPASEGLSGSTSSMRNHFSRCLEDQLKKQVSFDAGMAFCKSAAR